MRNKIGLFFFLLLTIVSLKTYAETFEGKVVRVLSGDTILVVRTSAPIEVRLYGIDTPELDQSFGKEAKKFTSDLCLNQIVVVDIKKVNNFLQSVSTVTLPDGKVLNEELISNGLAWWYKKDAPDNFELEELQEKANSSKLGLWSELNPIKPWDYRNGVRSAQTSSSSSKGNQKSQSLSVSAKGTMTESRPKSRSNTTTYNPQISQPINNAPVPFVNSSRNSNSNYYSNTSTSSSSPKPVHVKGYYRKDGTYVQSHTRSAPRR